MKKNRLVCLCLAAVMLFSIVSCGGTPATTASEEGSVGQTVSVNSDTASNPHEEGDPLYVAWGLGARVDKNGNLLYKPEDIGEIHNPVVHGIIAPPPDDEWYAQEVAWREEAYDLEYDFDAAPWDERDAKWVASYVAGDAYDVLTNISHPTTVIKGLLQPLDGILPVDDARYFNKKWVWNGQTYGVQPIAAETDFVDVGGMYGVWFNKTLFDENGLTDPVTLWEEGKWNFEAFYEAARALHLDTDKDGKNDIAGWSTWYKQMFTIGNGAKTVTYGSGDKLIELTWNDPKYVEGLEWNMTCQQYFGSNSTFTEGNLGMYIERLQQAKEYQAADVPFEYDWVPFPKGPSGEGYAGSISTGTWTVGIGAGAKNIEGAKVFICADIARYDYVEAENSSFMIGVTDEQVARALTCKDKLISDPFSGIGSMQANMYKVWDALPQNGVKATLEKYQPVMQAEIDKILATAVVDEPDETFKAPATLDFENGEVVLREKYAQSLVITEEADEIIGGEKSLKIQLSAETGIGALAMTTSQTVCLPKGTALKITASVKAVGGTAPADAFKLVLAPAAAFETGDLSKAFGNATVDLSDGAVHTVELMANVNESYSDLQVFVVGGTTADAPALSLILDDLTIEKLA